MITDIEELDLSKRYTYADYLTWQFDEMVELIRGKVFRMSPAPSTGHQAISRNLLILIGTYMDTRLCSVYHAPFDVRVPLPPAQQAAGKINTVVQPDLCIICDPDKIDAQGCEGAPDWIIEILSKSTARKDLTEKYDLYQHAGVREYWIVHPSEQTVIPYRLDDAGQYQLIRNTPFVREERIPVGIFPGFELDLSEVFED